MKVWRVAHETLVQNQFPSGPYIASGLTYEIDDALYDMSCSHNGDHHPAPYQDPSLGDIDPQERCGFDSLENCYRWFEGYEGLLQGLGFRIWEYEIPEEKVRIGKFGQALFRPAHVQFVSCSDFKKELVS